MPKKEAPLNALAAYLPEGTFELINEFLHEYKVHLTITRKRQSVLGDYRNATRSSNHRISINGDLNAYAFLITLLHELGHLLTYEQYGHQVQAHGKEWKTAFSRLLAQFLRQNIFPKDIHDAIQKTLHNPAASSCVDDTLMRVLHRYDPRTNGAVFVENIREGHLFQLKDGRVFRRENQLRKRIRCIEVKSGNVYLFSPIYEVVPVSA